MKRATLMLAALALLLGGVGSARAQATYYFTYNDGTDVGTGKLGTMSYVDPNNLSIQYATSGTLKLTSGPDMGTYSLLTTIPGTSPAQPVGETPTDLSHFFGFNTSPDNLLYPNNNAASGYYSGGISGSSYLDYNGLVFSNGSLYINIYGAGGATNYYFSDSSPNFVPPAGTFALVTPEPSGVALLGLGVVCLAIGYAVRRRKLALVAA